MRTKAATDPASPMSAGTTCMRSLAMTDSMTPTAHATRKMPKSEHSVCAHTEPREQRGEQPELDGGAVQHEGHVRAGVVEHHDFVNHGEFKVRVGVVHGNAAVFHEQQHAHGERQHDELGPAAQPRRGREAVEQRGERKLPFHAEAFGRGDEAEQHEKEHGFGQRAEKGLAARAHAFEGRTGVQRGKNGGEASHAQKIGAQDEIPLKGKRRGDAAEGQKRQRQHGGDHGDDRACGKHPGGAFAEHLALEEQLEDVVVELEQGLAVTAGELGLHAVDDAHGQRRKNERQHELGDVEPCVHYAIPQMRSATSVTRM